MNTQAENLAAFNSKLNWLRAGVLGANDGIVSVASLLLGVIAAGMSGTDVILVGIAATVSGAVSMGLGEYVSVSAQRDSEKFYTLKEKSELAKLPQGEVAQLSTVLEDFGIEKETAIQAALQIHRKDPLTAHLKLKWGIDPDEMTNPWVAAGSSALAFTLGAILPVLAASLGNAPVVTIATLVTLALTGFISSLFSGSSKVVAVMRLTIGGALGLAITYLAGLIFGA